MLQQEPRRWPLICRPWTNRPEMKMKSNVSWVGGMAFEADIEGFVVAMDSDGEHGGTGHGPKPKALLLSALGGCTAMDVVSILKKSRVSLTGFDLVVRSEVSKDHPKVFTGITIEYRFSGKDLPIVRLQRAIELSQERYCAVTAMLRVAVPIVWEMWIDGKKVERLPSVG